jgi:fermentation-respiration switch protein FrsA (DUF1100 family)
MLTKDFTLGVDGLDILGQLYLPAADMPYPTVCVCHGIPRGNPDPADGGYPLLAEQICRHGFAVLIFNFRGSGVSGGNLDILGWARDLKAVIDYLCALPEVDKSRLCLLGFSAGAAVSIYIASSDKRVSSVAACASPAEFTKLGEGQSLIERFRSIGAIRDKDFPPSAEEWLNGFRLVKPINYVAEISPRPLLLVQGSKDETVDVSHAYQLYEKAGEPKKLVIVDGAGHRLRRDDEAMAVVLDWLKSHTPPIP